MILNLQKGF